MLSNYKSIATACVHDLYQLLSDRRELEGMTILCGETPIKLLIAASSCWCGVPAYPAYQSSQRIHHGTRGILPPFPAASAATSISRGTSGKSHARSCLQAQGR